jgi:hypothetical protein
MIFFMFYHVGMNLIKVIYVLEAPLHPDIFIFFVVIVVVFLL